MFYLRTLRLRGDIFFALCFLFLCGLCAFAVNISVPGFCLAKHDGAVAEDQHLALEMPPDRA